MADHTEAGTEAENQAEAVETTNDIVQVRSAVELAATPVEDAESESETFITELSSDLYELIKPIRVVCSKIDGLYNAEAPEIGLILPGIGETEEEAVAHLTEMLVEQYEDCLGQDEHLIVGHAAIVFAKLQGYISDK